MQDLLAQLRARYGSLRDCTLALGVPENALAHLEQRMVE